jgi:hypothetical protein
MLCRKPHPSRWTPLKLPAGRSPTSYLLVVTPIAGRRFANSAACSLRLGKPAATGSLPCSSLRTIAVRRPSGQPPVATPNQRFSGTWTRAEKARIDRKSISVSPYRGSCSGHDRNDGHLVRFDRLTWKSVARSFFGSFDQQFSHQRLRFRGVMPAPRVVVQGRSLPRPGEEPRACAAPRRVAVPFGAAFEHAPLPRGP